MSTITGVAEWAGGRELGLEERAGAGGIGAPDVLDERGFTSRIGAPMPLPRAVWRPAQPRSGELQPGGKQEGNREDEYRHELGELGNRARRWAATWKAAGPALATMRPWLRL